MNKMPMKEPDLWAMIWSWLQINLGNGTIQSAGSAVVMSLLRMGFVRKKPAFRYMILDAAICASIAGVTVPICIHVFGHSEFAGFIGTMIGFIGTEKMREFLFRFINRRVDDGDINFRGERGGKYNDTDFRE